MTTRPGGLVKAINPFLVLGIDEDATREQIDAAHRRIVREHHPGRWLGRG